MNLRPADPATLVKNPQAFQRWLNRLARGYGSGAKLALAADTSVNNISRWRTGRRKPDDESIRKLAGAEQWLVRRQYPRQEIEPWGGGRKKA